jgi:hypothetical protein
MRRRFRGQTGCKLAASTIRLVRLPGTANREREDAVGILVTLIGLAGYILPIPSLVWGWFRWWTSKPRFEPDKWRRIAVFLGLSLASIIGLSVLFVISHANGLPEGPTKYSFALAASRIGFRASAVALVLSVIGKGPARLPAALASVGLAALWIIAIVTY